MKTIVILTSKAGSVQYALAGKTQISLNLLWSNFCYTHIKCYIDPETKDQDNKQFADYLIERGFELMPYWIR